MIIHPVGVLIDADDGSDGDERQKQRIGGSKTIVFEHEYFENGKIAGISALIIQITNSAKCRMENRQHERLERKIFNKYKN